MVVTLITSEEVIPVGGCGVDLYTAAYPVLQSVSLGGLFLAGLQSVQSCLAFA